MTISELVQKNSYKDMFVDMWLVDSAYLHGTFIGKHTYRVVSWSVLLFIIQTMLFKNLKKDPESCWKRFACCKMYRICFQHITQHQKLALVTYSITDKYSRFSIIGCDNWFVTGYGVSNFKQFCFTKKKYLSKTVCGVGHYSDAIHKNHES